MIEFNLPNFTKVVSKSILIFGTLVTSAQAGTFMADVKGGAGSYDGKWTFRVVAPSIIGGQRAVKFTVTGTPPSNSQFLKPPNNMYRIPIEEEENFVYTFNGTDNRLTMEGVFDRRKHTLEIEDDKIVSEGVEFEVTNVTRVSKKRKKSVNPKSGQKQPTGKMNYDEGTKKLSFTDIFLDEAILTDGTESLDDPILGASVTVGDSLLLEQASDNTGWFFEGITNYKIEIGGISVLTANLFETFLFVGGGEMHPEFDSEFQGVLDDIVINNVINSPYLDDLAAYISAGGSSHFSMSGNILSATNNFTKSGSSSGIAWAQDGTKVPEPSSSFGFFILSIVGTASALKRKLNSSKSSEKETAKVS